MPTWRGFLFKGGQLVCWAWFDGVTPLSSISGRFSVFVTSMSRDRGYAVQNARSPIFSPPGCADVEGHARSVLESPFMGRVMAAQRVLREGR